MDPGISRWRTAAAPTEELLASRYGQLLQWAEMLARGDRGVAQEIVHDLCLQLTLSRPNFSGIANPDGYLYTCLRHLYLSRLARSSREAVRFVSIADCDSVQFALDVGQRVVDSLEMQNVLRRICGYSVWRKEQAKSFSYFILHFFHGYFQREIAELACLPTAAIYNKGRAARTELKAHLDDPAKLRFSNRESPPKVHLSWIPVSSPELFRELRRTILGARTGACLPEEELVARYRANHPAPLPCSLLAHIVSCERCLEILDRHLRRPTLKDRDSLDGLDLTADARGGNPRDAETMLRSLIQRRRRIFEHRPASLSIAINGRIAASHEVRGEYSLLSARFEPPESAHFVEVFSEQDQRLALLATENRPPDGPHSLSQRTALSDDRWLELKVEFDGLGLNSEVTYFDSALAQALLDEETEAVESGQVVRVESERASERALIHPARFFPALAGLARRLTPSPALGWAVVVLCGLAGGGYMVWRSTEQPPDARTILSQSIQAEATSLSGRAEHQYLSVEKVSADGRILVQGTVDLWKDGISGRYMRRLYDSHHRLLAAEWQTRNGERGSWTAKTGQPHVNDRELSVDDWWMEDLSPRSFRAMVEPPVHMTATTDGYELSGPVHDAARSQLVSATLILNRGLMPVGAMFETRSGSAVQTVRLLQTALTMEPTSMVPDAVFDPESLERSERVGPQSFALPIPNQFSPSPDVRLAALQIGVLYSLDTLGMDAGEPIKVERKDHMVRVAGTVADDARRQRIIDALHSLPGSQSLDVQLTSQQHLRSPAPPDQQPSTVYNVMQNEPLADPVLRSFFEHHPPPGETIDAVVVRFEGEALGHGQRALQNAWALDRLGSHFTAEELRTVGPASRHQWAEMVAAHAAGLETELQHLRGQLDEIGVPGSPSSAPANLLENPSEFAHAARLLLQKTQVLNREVGFAFASGSGQATKENSQRILSDVAGSIPLSQAADISQLALRLTGTGKQSTGTYAGKRSAPSDDPN